MLTKEELSKLESELPVLSPDVRAIIKKLLAENETIEKTLSLTILDLPGEKWRWIEGYESLYQVSSFGRVKSFQRGRISILKLSMQNKYLMVSLFKDNEYRKFLVHRLVAKAFISNPDNKPVVDHIDGNKTNNCVENLRWATNSENNLYALYAGAIKIGEERSDSKLTNEQAKYIRDNYKANDTEFGQHALAKKFGVCRSLIRNIISGKSWKHID